MHAQECLHGSGCVGFQIGVSTIEDKEKTNLVGNVETTIGMVGNIYEARLLSQAWITRKLPLTWLLSN